MSLGIKHLVQCRCILPQFRGDTDPVFHKFVVFSTLDEKTDEVTPKHVQCPNCGVVHKVTELSKSEILSVDESAQIRTIDDISLSLPSRLEKILRTYKVDIATWEEAEFIINEQKWGGFVILDREQDSSTTKGKLLRIKGENSFMIEQFESTREFS